ncbi:MAG TPA: hypothetical protein H9687_08465 [Firmicutes bacterium]|mgnify:FL=1|nr:hypothetical protein [Bacillota bacterium]
MIQEIGPKEQKTVEKIAVCITAQSNSKRLIDRGAFLADLLDGDLHILHVQQGSSIFHTAGTPQLLEELFAYGSKKGGMIHFHCDENVARFLGDFTRQNGITRLILGQPPMQDLADRQALLDKLMAIVANVDPSVPLVIVPREEGQADITLRR